MKLVIDCFKLVKGAGKSIGIYNLAKTLVTYLGAENHKRGMEHTIYVLGNDYNRADFETEGVKFIKINKDPLDRKTFLLWELFGVVKEANRLGADRVLFPRGYRPLFYTGKDTIIIHDLIPFFYHEHFPDVFGKLENAYIMNRLKASIKGADRVITISDYSRKDIIRRVKNSRNKITVINNGLNDIKTNFTKEGKAVPLFEEDGTVKLHPIDECPVNYIVAVTSKLPHKNAEGILRAYDAYYRIEEKPLPLVIVGIKDTFEYEKKGCIHSSITKDVICYEYIGNYADLCDLIQGARFFLFLSLIEGFGFPPLEAMQLGCPVISSGRTSLNEVLGDAAMVVDPVKPQEVAEAMEKLQNNEELQRELVKRGYENIKRFTWDKQLPKYWEELFSK